MNRGLFHGGWLDSSDRGYMVNGNISVTGRIKDIIIRVFSVPLAARIHEGLVWSNRDRRTLLDKMLGLLDILALKAAFYLLPMPTTPPARW
jgi:hypothetical protein